MTGSDTCPAPHADAPITFVGARTLSVPWPLTWPQPTARCATFRRGQQEGGGDSAIVAWLHQSRAAT